jgi:hypothetical protein
MRACSGLKSHACVWPGSAGRTRVPVYASAQEPADMLAIVRNIRDASGPTPARPDARVSIVRHCMPRPIVRRVASKPRPEQLQYLHAQITRARKHYHRAPAAQRAARAPRGYPQAHFLPPSKCRNKPALGTDHPRDHQRILEPLAFSPVTIRNVSNRRIVTPRKDIPAPRACERAPHTRCLGRPGAPIRRLYLCAPPAARLCSQSWRPRTI